MYPKQKKGRKCLRINSQCFFLVVGVLGFIYVWFLLEVLDVDKDGEVQKAFSPIIQPGKPPLEDYVQGWNITKDVNWLLHFSIVGFPKTGTSSLMLFLKSQIPSIYMFDDERCELGANQQVPLLRDLHKNYQTDLRMGIKCPRDLETGLALDNYRSLFPKTKFIVGIRNPIQWFESFYNFRVQNDFPMLPPQKLIGKCHKLNLGVCTKRANFSEHLSKIENTRKVFLYDVHQLRSNESTNAFLKDLGDFLELETPLVGPILRVKPGRKPISKEHEAEIKSKQINICDEEYSELRQILHQQASKSADWIIDEFLTNPNVKVSSIEYFKGLLQQWHDDPCIQKKTESEVISR